MWKMLLTMGLLLSLCSLAGCETQKAEDLSSLGEFSRPYAGVYECTRLMLGSREVTEEFVVRLELAYNGSFTLSYRPKYGPAGERKGTYAVDMTREEVTMSAVEGQTVISRTYPMQDGAILVEENFGGVGLYAEFRPE